MRTIVDIRQSQAKHVVAILRGWNVRMPGKHQALYKELGLMIGVHEYMPKKQLRSWSRSAIGWFQAKQSRQNHELVRNGVVTSPVDVPGSHLLDSKMRMHGYSFLGWFFTRKSNQPGGPQVLTLTLHRYLEPW